MDIEIKKPQNLSLVRCTSPHNPTLVQGNVYIYLGELANMPGHCVVAEMQTGHVYGGFHTENFVELNEDEV